jgi:hypothetical protein
MCTHATFSRHIHSFSLMYVDEPQKSLNFNLRIRKFMQIILKMCVVDRVNKKNI